ncbi:MAG: RagB/SusD family nutrient uptake outer membrane protein [Sphingobacterium sp.]|uniref:RagB/SusD family nutrient uptake outer membrane protein n=1 Tax=Sphingobacterium sp. JB170 TaxID=1434842 RepID=UPI00097EC315|nr:RagB/SusD family nutrient uptake outer membrane protein [Sphingobacterium sp. JB170]SJN26657.1 Putative outer membrane protein, probably involved in nutrient binding [Sphingobacterium sp. JB170]
MIAILKKKLLKTLYVPLSGLLCCCFHACSLDYPLEDKISDPGAIDRLSVARELLNTAYLRSFKDLSTLAMLGDDFGPTRYSAQFMSSQFWLWKPEEISVSANNLWPDAYQAISTANTFLQRADEIEVKGEQEESELRKLRGEALAIKAWNYYILLRLYAPNIKEAPKADAIVLRNTDRPTQEGRSSVEQVYSHLDSLTTEAATLLAEGGTDGSNVHGAFFNSSAMWALQTELAVDREEWQDALTYGEQLLSRYTQLDADTYTALWKTNGYQSNESVMALGTHSEIWTTIEYQSPLYGRSSALNIASDIINSYSEEDLRRQTLLPDTNGGYTIGKYRTKFFETEFYPIHLFRTARILLLCAEAAYRLGDQDKARSYLNRLQEARQSPLSQGSGKTLWIAIQAEFRKELVGEWYRFFDLKRWRSELKHPINTSGTEVLDIQASDYRWVWPIPNAEIVQSEGKIQQNPNWIHYEE